MGAFHYASLVFYYAYAIVRHDLTQSAVGILGWVIEPLLYLGAFYLVLSVLQIRGGVDAVPFLLPGLVVWKWFAISVQKGGTSIMQAGSVMQQIYVPKFVFFASVLLAHFYQFAIMFLVMVGFLFLLGLSASIIWLLVFPVMLVQAMLIVGVAGFFAVLMPFFNDLKIVLSNGMTLLFLLSGVFFDIGRAPEEYRQILLLNPVAPLVQAYRTVLLESTSPDWFALLYSLVFAIALIIPVILLFRRWDRVFPRALSS